MNSTANREQGIKPYAGVKTMPILFFFLAFLDKLESDLITLQCTNLIGTCS